jgi:hypothetical protein
MRTGRSCIFARNPNIAFAVPTMVARTPRPAWMLTRRRRHGFDDRRRRADAYHDLCMGRDGRGERDNRCTCCGKYLLLHGQFSVYNDFGMTASPWKVLTGKGIAATVTL